MAVAWRPLSCLAVDLLAGTISVAGACGLAASRGGGSTASHEKTHLHVWFRTSRETLATEPERAPVSWKTYQGLQTLVPQRDQLVASPSQAGFGTCAGQR